MSYQNEPDFSALLGRELSAISGADAGSESIKFTCADGDVFELYHEQDCCESVSVEDVCGDVADLLGSPITLAEESTSDKFPEGVTPDYEPESFTWTFYRLATAKGAVTLRWYGSSNGYYSESVYFRKAAP